MKSPYCIKVCSKCKRLLVAYSGNFNKMKSGKYGLRNNCNECRKKYREKNKEEIAEYSKQYYEDNKEKIAEYMKQYYEDNKEEIAEYNKQYYEDNKEYYAEHNKQHRKDNKEYYAEYMKQYYEDNKEEIAEKHKQYREDNKEKIAEYKKQYYEDNKEGIAEHMKQYREDNPHIFFNNHNKRRSREENQGNGITKEQWVEMMKFFNWCCAYSGEYLGGENNKNIRTVDHVVPLAEGGLNEIWNCVPMLKSYNSNKHTNDMLTWYTKQDFYSEDRLNKIYEWIEYAKNKWGDRKEAI